MKELTFAERLRMEQQPEKHDSVQANTNFIKDIIRAVTELASDSNKKGKNYISGYIYISGGDPGDWFPMITDAKASMEWMKMSNYYDLEDLNTKVRQKIRELGFTDFKVNITKERHKEKKYTQNWLGIYKTQITDGEGEDYFVWVDIKW